MSNTNNTCFEQSYGGARTKDNHSVAKRLQQELATLLTTCEPGVSAFPEGDNLFYWVGTIEGGKGTENFEVWCSAAVGRTDPSHSLNSRIMAGDVYEGLKYKLSLVFPSGYPYKPPTVKFDTPCYHPNVDNHGNICLDILKEKWSALYDVRTILLSIQSLLAEPNIDSPLNSHAADLWHNQTAFKKYLREKYDKDVCSKGQS